MASCVPELQCEGNDRIASLLMKDTQAADCMRESAICCVRDNAPFPQCFGWGKDNSHWAGEETCFDNMILTTEHIVEQLLEESCDFQGTSAYLSLH